MQEECRRGSMSAVKLEKRWERLRGRYDVLLVLILLAIIVQMADPSADGPHIGRSILQGLILVVAVAVARPDIKLIRYAIAFAAVLIVCDLLGLFLGRDASQGITRVTALLLVIVTPISIISGLLTHLRKQGVTVQVMFGVLCLYLLIGILFATIYAVDGEFFEKQFFVKGEGTPANYLYFSFVTLTTVGYGDLIAAGGIGRGFAIAEALFGQIYLVTVVALIVANLKRPPGGRARRRS